MGQFKNIGFTFDGVNGEDLGYYIVSTSSGGENYMGVTKKIQEEESSNFAPSFQGVKYEVITFDITIAKIGKYGDCIPLSEDDIFFLNQWLLQPEDYRIFTSHQNRDILYYVMFTQATNFLNGAREGYINLTMRLSSGCSYSTIAHHQAMIAETKTFEIYNKSNVEQYIYPDVWFYKDTTGDISIINDTLGEEMKFTNIPSGTTVSCYNEGVKQVVCDNDPSLNLRPNFNKKWLRLGYGRNTVRVVGECQIDIFFQNKIAIQN